MKYKRQKRNCEDERLFKARKLQPLESQASFRFDQQPHSFSDPGSATAELVTFLKSGNSVSIGREFLDEARHAAFHIKNFKYSVIEAFTSTEYVVTKYLTDEKKRKGASKKKLKDFETLITMSYKLNIELPVYLENLTSKERELIGDVDRVRRLRNKIVHEGRVATRDDAEFAVEKVSKLFEMFVSRGVEV